MSLSPVSSSRAGWKSRRHSEKGPAKDSPKNEAQAGGWLGGRGSGSFGRRTVWPRVGLAVAGLVLLLAQSALATTDLFIVPGGLADVEGNGNNTIPFVGSALATVRYQQVYAASAFGVSGPCLIKQIAFRPDATFGVAFSSTITNLQIDLSTTSVGPGGLSSSFAANVGANDQVVFNGSLALSSACTGPVGGPKNFDIVIDLQNPFSYDPGSGNLLLDVRRFTAGVFYETAFDSDSTGSAMSRASTLLNDAGVYSPTASFLDSVGLVTRFTVTPVPEPGTAAVLAVGALGLAGRFWRPARCITPILKGCIAAERAW